MRSHRWASVSSSGSEKQREEVLTYDRHVRAACLCEALAAEIGQAGVGAARVVLAGAALQQAVALEAVDQAGEPATRELGLLGEVAHAHAPGAGIVEVMEDLVGGHRQAVLALELGVQALGQAGVRAQKAAPCMDLGLAE